MSNKHLIEGLGEFPPDWSIAPLGHFVEYVTYGFTNPMPDSEAGPFKLTAKDVNGGRILYETARHTTWEAYNELLSRKSKPTKGDVLLTKDGSIGRVAVVDRDDVCINQSVAVMRPRATTDARFLAYLLQAPYYQDRMVADADGSTIKHIYITRVDKMLVAVPTRDQQQAIAAVLGSLDDKIEQNRRTGRALERLARATFKAWFVDFEPVKAKAAGATSFPGMPASAFAALPNRLTDSPVGPVPQGWEVRRLDSVLTLHYGKSLPKTMRGSGEVPVYGSGGVTGTHSGALVNGPGIIVGRKGSVGTLYWENDGFYPIYTTYYVKPAAELGLHYLFELLRTLGLEDMNTDAAVPGLNRENAYRLEVPVPTAAVADCFEEYAMTLRDMVSHLAAESSKLAALRDYLLPRLLSGRVRVRPSQEEAKG